MDIERLNIIEKNFAKKKIAVIGDLMLDGYFWGDVTRVSPEAPVPVVEIDNEFFRFGGAANVALNILHLTFPNWRNIRRTEKVTLVI